MAERRERSEPARPHAPGASVGPLPASVSPDGESLAFLRRRDGPYGELAIADAETGAVRRLTSDDSLVTSPVWSPDGRSIYVCSSRGGTLNVWKLDARSGAAQRITAGVGDDAEIDVAKDGTRLVFSTYRANVNLGEVALSGGHAAPARWLTTDSTRGEGYPRYSPDGQRVAYFSNRLGGEHESRMGDERGREPTPRAWSRTTAPP